MTDQHSPLEDWRGVDVGQIRSQLRMSVAERVRHMVEVTDVMMEIRDKVRIIQKRETL